MQRGSPISRALALAILAIVVAIVIQISVQPILKIFDDNRKLFAELETLLQRYQTLIAERPKVIERLEMFKTNDRFVNFHLKNASEALAAAELQDLVSTVVESAGGQIKSVQILPPVDVDDDLDLRKNVVKVRFLADVDTLTEAIYELESIEPLLVIGRLQVSVVRVSESEEKQEAMPELDIRIDVSGYARRQEGTNPDKAADPR